MTEPPGPYQYPPQQYPPPPYYYVRVGPPPPMSPAGVPLAEFWQRLVAYIIDAALVGALVFVAVLAGFIGVIATVPDSIEGSNDPSVFFGDFFVPLLLVELGGILFMLLLYYLYEVEYMHRTGQTLGKRAMKIRVVPIDPSATLTRGMAARRYLVQHVAGIAVPFFSYLDGLWQLWDRPYLQTLHDKAAQTVVVKVSA